MNSYHDLIAKPTLAPAAWQTPCTHSETTLHQLSPYIGKLKSSIARDLICAYSKPGDLIADVFCGSGTVPLESVTLGRRTFASDAGLYAITLTKGKLHAPQELEAVHSSLDEVLLDARSVRIDLRTVPKWVRAFYHPRTLKETLAILEELRLREDNFLLACLLGISHHQRPGFLSFPSSHLVPYLRSKKFPVSDFPELYTYRQVEPRIRAKVERALKRGATLDRKLIVGIQKSSVEDLSMPFQVDCFLTSPPYMNALDYGRDNRLRNWLLGSDTGEGVDNHLSKEAGFRSMMSAFASLVESCLATRGACVIVVGEKTVRKSDRFPSEVISEVMNSLAPSLTLTDIISDHIPDIRRSRRHLAGVKRENILVYRRLG